MSDEHETYWISQIGAPPAKRWYKLVDRFALAYGLTEIVRLGEGAHEDIVVQPIGKPDYIHEDDNRPVPARYPELPSRRDGYFRDFRTQRP